MKVAVEKKGETTIGGRSDHAWRRLWHEPQAVVSGGVLLLVMAFCFVGPMFLSDGVETIQDPERAFAEPSLEHVAGTDKLGRDMFARLMKGGALSLLVGGMTTLVSVGIGTMVGAISGMMGGKTDAILMRLVDVLYGFPLVLLVILLSSVYGETASAMVAGWGPGLWRESGDLFVLFFAIAFVEWLTTARIVRGQVMVLRRQEFVEAAHLLGVSRLRIITRHILPHVAGPVLAYGTLTVPAVMLLESTLSFLGLGVQPPKSSWGVLIKEGADSMMEYPWLLAFPAVIFAITLLSLNFLGDTLRDVLDPRSKKS